MYLVISHLRIRKEVEPRPVRVSDPLHKDVYTLREKGTSWSLITKNLPPEGDEGKEKKSGTL